MVTLPWIAQPWTSFLLLSPLVKPCDFDFSVKCY
jgi:hypothetical protein